MDIKQPKTHEQHLELLKSRGCIIEDESFCLDVLSKVNYYRFSAYFLPFRNTDRKTYKPNTTFNQIYNIYEFDQHMRHLVFSILEEVEVYMRSKIAYFHAHKYGSLGYEDAGNFNAKHDHVSFLKLLSDEKNKNKNVLFVKHHIDNYCGKMPIWAIIELFSFGMLSRFYSDLPTGDRNQLANELFGFDESLVRSWLQCCTNLRNICAHYGRLYFRLLGATPLTPKGYKYTLDKNLFSALTMLKLMSIDVNRWNTFFMIELKSLICNYSGLINLQHIGFPNDWPELLAQNEE